MTTTTITVFHTVVDRRCEWLMAGANVAWLLALLTHFNLL